MQYRHSFHAGNFADVHKHVALLALVAALQKKDKGFLYLDTHAGEGLYSLTGPEARLSAESESGIARLERALAQAAAPHPAIRHYMDCIVAIRRGLAHGRHLYPGSPLLAASRLRAADRAICVESEASQVRALQRALDALPEAPAGKVQVMADDGYRQLKALLPPPQRRALVLIDPPYERADEEAQVGAGIAAALQRFESGVYAVWYPIKRRHDSDLWLSRLTRGITRPTLVVELCVRRPDSAVGLNGSGMLIVNPPWQFDLEAAEWQTGLHDLLGGEGGSALRWLVNE